MQTNHSIHTMKRLSIILAAAVLAVLGAQNAYAQSYASLGADPDDYPSFRIGLNAGWGYRTGQINPNLSPEQTEHVRKLKSGFVLGADATWFFLKDMGFGATFHQFNSAHNTARDSHSDAGTLDITEEIQMNYIAPQLSSRYMFGRGSLLLDISAGYLSYRDYYYMGYEYRVNGHTMGYGANVGFDFALTRKLAIGASFDAVTGVLKKYRIKAHGKAYDEELDKDHYESLNHFTVTAGLRLTL